MKKLKDRKPHPKAEKITKVFFCLTEPKFRKGWCKMDDLDTEGWFVPREAVKRGKK